MDLNQVNELLSRYNGNRSVIYPLVANDLRDYEYWELPFIQEFLFFEDNYLTILKFILENGLSERKVVDVGCQYGIQSVIFDGFEYEGLDVLKGRFFYREDLNNSYRVGDFMEMNDIDLSDKIVISSMSLGFFERDSLENKEELSLSQRIGIEKLSSAKHLFVASTDIYVAGLEARFKKKVCLVSEAQRSKLYYFTNS